MTNIQKTKSNYFRGLGVYISKIQEQSSKVRITFTARSLRSKFPPYNYITSSFNQHLKQVKLHYKTANNETTYKDKWWYPLGINGIACFKKMTYWHLKIELRREILQNIRGKEDHKFDTWTGSWSTIFNTPITIFFMIKRRATVKSSTSWTPTLWDRCAIGCGSSSIAHTSNVSAQE